MSIATPTRIRNMSRTTLAITAFGLGLATVGLVMSAGSIGIVGGAVLAICWFIVPPLYTAGVGFVIAVALVPDGFTGISFAPLGLGILCVLAAPSLDRTEPAIVAISAATGLSVLLAAGGGAFLWTTAILPSALALLVAFALIAYTIHRYEIVRMGLIKASETL
ncbi:hypothetical protein [Halalkalicoccus salilacus]|uniref:hypothetical protein n=1 Tax=Halalkalicoccus TaxID=332246 RepID=UPI002F9631AB